MVHVPALNPRIGLLAFLLLVLPVAGGSQETMDHSGHGSQETMDHSGHGSHQMTVGPDGVVMNENHATVPRDCPEISRDYAFTVKAGRTHARDFPGMIFGMNPHEINVEPCSRIEITFVNEDAVRHQWMVHGLPKYLYPAGMFHIEASGGHSMKGSFIVPGEDATYLVHCDMAQHMEKGMRGQLVVGGGSGNLWGIPGISGEFYRSAYLPGYALLLALAAVITAFFASIWLMKRN